MSTISTGCLPLALHEHIESVEQLLELSSCNLWNCHRPTNPVSTARQKRHLAKTPGHEMTLPCAVTSRTAAGAAAARAGVTRARALHDVAAHMAEHHFTLTRL